MEKKRKCIVINFFPQKASFSELTVLVDIPLIYPLIDISEYISKLFQVDNIYNY